ncbi:wax ester synthase-like acyl-CoA acyltransferase domain-containing protein [Polychytrium aggregatum]|uniref:wax ester synthase-like acyl-CoA acyltransferase domain-containing protein n=1 Tax=Polychytrium aggregatum TaxID=110093 RepID=UPI0022FE196C|nr:wax ester synthase-like acyl-CoA acyltransferase domain-containing protein [Polychytrium aggregatum]KAI9208372.1 wax ester synthase-like acyl-CoA acyltransferase domain-containing protein [Polychytrium aggregatum]
MASVSKEYLEPFDNLFLALEDDYHLMSVAGVYTLSRLVSISELKSNIDGFARITGRCLKRVVWNKNDIFDRPYFVADENYSIDNHFTVVDVPAPGTLEQIQDLASEHFSKKFDFNKPLWECIYFRGALDGAKTVYLFKVHHAIADGQGFVRALLKYISEISPETEVSEMMYKGNQHSGSAATNTSKPAPSHLDSKDKPKQHDVRKTLEKLSRSSILLAYMVFGILMAIFVGLRLVASFKHSFSRSRMTANKQVAWSAEPISLTEVKLIKNTFRCTVNDVLMSCMGVAIQRYLESQNALKDSSFWVLVPTSMRRHDDWSVSNRTSGYMLNLPLVSKGERVRHLQSVSKRMKAQKGTMEPHMYFGFIPILWHWVNLLPKWTQFTAYKVHAVITNVPGPASQLYWGSSAVENVVGLIPQPAPNALGTTIYSYDGKIVISVLMDLDQDESDDLLFAPGSARVIVQEYAKAFEELLTLAKDELEAQKNHVPLEDKKQQ